MRLYNPPQFVAIETSLGPVTGDELGATVDGIDKIKSRIAGTTIHAHAYEIGAWNMDTTEYVGVAHNEDYERIIGAMAVIISDEKTFVRVVSGQIEHHNDALTERVIPDVRIDGITSVAVRLYRTTGGYYDSTSFNDITINRGYVLLWVLD